MTEICSLITNFSESPVPTQQLSTSKNCPTISVLFTWNSFVYCSLLSYVENVSGFIIFWVYFVWVQSAMYPQITIVEEN